MTKSENNHSQFIIYRSTVSGTYSTVLTSTAGTTYSDTTVSNGTTYYYVISATNPGGESPVSSEVSAAPQIPPPPATPAGFRAQAGNANLLLRWITSPGATSYNLYRSTSSAPFNAGNLLTLQWQSRQMERCGRGVMIIMVHLELVP